jgi:hypothetical protein
MLTIATSLFMCAMTGAVYLQTGGWAALFMGVIGTAITAFVHCAQQDIKPYDDSVG